MIALKDRTTQRYFAVTGSSHGTEPKLTEDCVFGSFSILIVLISRVMSSSRLNFGSFDKYDVVNVEEIKGYKECSS